MELLILWPVYKIVVNFLNQNYSISIMLRKLNLGSFFNLKIKINIDQTEPTQFELKDAFVDIVFIVLYQNLGRKVMICVA